MDCLKCLNHANDDDYEVPISLKECRENREDEEETAYQMIDISQQNPETIAPKIP